MSHLDEHEQATVQRPQQQMCQVGEKGKQFHGGRSQRLGLGVGEHLFGQQIGHPDRLEQSFRKEFLDRGLPALVAGFLNRRHLLTYLRGERFVCPGGIDDDLELLRIHAFLTRLGLHRCQWRPGSFSRVIAGIAIGARLAVGAEILGTPENPPSRVPRSHVFFRVFQH